MSYSIYFMYFTDTSWFYDHTNIFTEIEQNDLNKMLKERIISKFVELDFCFSFPSALISECGTYPLYLVHKCVFLILSRLTLFTFRKLKTPSMKKNIHVWSICVENWNSVTYLSVCQCRPNIVSFPKSFIGANFLLRQDPQVLDSSSFLVSTTSLTNQSHVFFNRYLSSCPQSPVCHAVWQIISVISCIWTILRGSWSSFLADPKFIFRGSPSEWLSPDSFATSFWTVSMCILNAYCDTGI